MRRLRAAGFGVAEDVFSFEGSRVQAYVPEAAPNHGGDALPVVLAMHGTGYDADSVAFGCGWVPLAGREGLVVVAPNYDAYRDVGGMTGHFAALASHAVGRYAADPRRVYATGFSNGGAAATLLAARHTGLFAGVSAMGWMLDPIDSGGIARHGMPIQVIQGTREFTERMASGAVAVMECERDAIRTLMRGNGMRAGEEPCDYARWPYFGYKPDSERSGEADGRRWVMRDFARAGYRHPFAQLVTVEGAAHEVHAHEAEVAWAFLRHFSRSEGGAIVEDLGSGGAGA